MAAAVPGAGLAVGAGKLGNKIAARASSTLDEASAIVPKGGNGAVNNATKAKLNKQLASEEQIEELNSGVAERIAGAGTNKQLRDAPRLVKEYGGEVDDWAKVGSSNRKHLDGFSQETHAYQNVKTGQIVEHKTKISGH